MLTRIIQSPACSSDSELSPLSKYGRSCSLGICPYSAFDPMSVPLAPLLRPPLSLPSPLFLLLSYCIRVHFAHITAEGDGSKRPAEPINVEKQKQNTVFLVAMLILGVASIFISFAAMAICYRFDSPANLLWCGASGTGLLLNE